MKLQRSELRGHLETMTERVIAWLQVAERSLFLWNNEYIVSLVAQHRQTVLPLVFGALESNGGHWNPAVTGLTNNVRKLFQEMDEPLYEECRRRHEDEAVSHPQPHPQPQHTAATV